MEVGTVLVIAALIGLLPAWIASRKGHSFVTWWIFGALLFIVALPMAIFAKDKRARCPECAEIVRPEATRCPHCQASIEGRIVQYVTPSA
jgi:hypothetical protein